MFVFWKLSKTVLTPIVSVSWKINFIVECESSPIESKGKFFHNFRKEEVWSIYVEREREKPLFLFFSPQFKIVAHIVKMSILHDEQFIISRINVAEAEYMVVSKKQEGGGDWSLQRRIFPFQRRVSVRGDFKIVTHYESTVIVF